MNLAESVNNFFWKLKSYLPKDKGKRIVVLLILLIAIPITVILVQKVVRFFSKAAAATLYLEADGGTTLPPDRVIRVMVNSGSTQVGFARVVLTFNPSHLRLTGEVTTSNQMTMDNNDVPAGTILPEYACTGTTPCIIKTPMSAANSTGRIVIVLAKDPRDSAGPPSGIFELARFTVTPNTTSSVSTPISFESYQLVDMNASEFSVSTTAITLSLNAGGTTPTPTSGLITNLKVFDSTNATDWSIQSNLQVGNIQYGDRTFSFTQIPSSHLGREWIRTANDSKTFASDPTVTFVVSQNATVYIAHDNRLTTKPSWLTGWTKTSTTITNSEPTTFSLYSKQFSAGQTVSLGPNRASNDTSNLMSMYTIIVAPSAIPTFGVTNTPTPTPPGPTGSCTKPGDANCDGKVDGFDYVIWWMNFNRQVGGGPSEGDFNGDGLVDGFDYVIWWMNFGK